MKEYIVQEETVYGRHGAYEILNTANKVELIRCKDCKKYGDNKKCPIEALINSDSKQFFAFDENWFCADGERK